MLKQSESCSTNEGDRGQRKNKKMFIPTTDARQENRYENSIRKLRNAHNIYY